MAGILLIDDAKITHHLLRNILENVGYTVCGEASNGKEGIEKYNRYNPELVFCDIMMKEMNGLEFLKAIKAMDPEAKVVICTSVGSKSHIEEARNAGAVDYIVKPIKAANVIDVAEKLIGKPAPFPKVSYKHLMEERALAEGLESRHVLDFFEAFLKANSFGLDDARINRQYLISNIDSLTISIRALLSAKMSTAQVNTLMDIFQSLTL